MELTLIELHDLAGGGPAMLAVHAVEFVQPIYETRPGSREPVLYDGRPRAAGSRIMLASGVIVEVAETPEQVAERMVVTYLRVDPDANAEAVPDAVAIADLYAQRVADREDQ